MSFFHKKNVTKFMGHHYAIWASDSNILLVQKNCFGPAFGCPSFQALVIKNIKAYVSLSVFEISGRPINNVYEKFSRSMLIFMIFI